MAKSSYPEGDKHHYIPKFYLKQWAVDRRLCEFSRPRDKVIWRRKFPDATGYQRGLYTFRELSPALTNYIEERFLQYADNNAYAALLRLLDGNAEEDGSGVVKSAWSRFIMTLFHRSPEGIARIKNSISNDLPDQIEQFRPKFESLRIAEVMRFEEFCKTLTPADLESINLQTLCRVMDSELLGTVLNGMLWTVLNTDYSNYPLLTSDRPIIMTNGLKDPNAHILMPISPRHLFIAANTTDTLNIVLNMQYAGIVQRVNSTVIRQARKYVYAVDNKPLHFVADRLGEKARWSPWE